MSGARSAGAARPGEVVTREQLRERLWADETFVDFDQGLNTAINKLREVLGDSVANPRFIETLPKRGYRFLFPIEAEPAAGHEELEPRPQLRLTYRTAVAVALTMAVAGFTIWWPRRPVSEAPLPLRRFSIRPPAPMPTLPGFTLSD